MSHYREISLKIFDFAFISHYLYNKFSFTPSNIETYIFNITYMKDVELSYKLTNYWPKQKQNYECTLWFIACALYERQGNKVPAVIQEKNGLPCFRHIHISPAPNTETWPNYWGTRYDKTWTKGKSAPYWH